MLDSSAEYMPRQQSESPQSIKETILNQLKEDMEKKEAQRWDNKVLAFLKEKAAREGIDSVSLDKNGRFLTYRFGDKKVTLEIRFFNVTVGETGSSSCLVMPRNDYENNPWFQEVFTAYPADLRLS